MWVISSPRSFPRSVHQATRPTEPNRVERNSLQDNRTTLRIETFRKITIGIQLVDNQFVQPL